MFFQLTDGSGAECLKKESNKNAERVLWSRKASHKIKIYETLNHNIYGIYIKSIKFSFRKIFLLDLFYENPLRIDHASVVNDQSIPAKFSNKVADLILFLLVVHPIRQLIP